MASRPDWAAKAPFPEIQRIVERTAIDHNIPLVDFGGILQSDCLHFHGHDIPRTEYFLDHVHPTIAAHGLLAVAIFEALTQKGIVIPNRLWRADAVARVSERIDSRVDHAVQARALTNLAQVLSWAVESG